MRHRTDRTGGTARIAGSTVSGAGWVWLLLRILAVLAVPTCLVLVVPAAPANAAPDAPAATEVSFVGSGGVVLHGTVLTPVSAAQRRPAVVMLEGAGNRGRQELRLAAEAFARRGIVTLTYDKRTEGYNLFRRDYSVLADDALAGLRLLRSRADVDPARIGMWALSEGAFAAPLAASRSTDVKFLITAGALGMTPAAQTASCYDERLRHAGVSGSLSRMMQVTAVRMTIAAGIFPEANFDPVPAWTQVTQPVLAQWGEFDREALPRESSQVIQQALERGGNHHYTIRFVPAVRHNLYATANGGFDRLADIPADYGDYEAAWINRLAFALPSATVGQAPPQHAPSPTFTPLAWYESPWLQLAALLLFLVAFAGYPLTAAVRRIRGRRGAPPVRHPARWLAATGLVTTLGAFLYLFFMLATAAALVGPVLFGRPVAWLVLQGLSVATVAATVATGLSWRRHRLDLTPADRARLGLLAAAGLTFLPWAAYWGLLIP